MPEPLTPELILANYIRLWHTLPSEQKNNEDVQAKLAQTCGFIDADYYLRRYPDVAAHGMDAGVHYVHYGFREGRICAPWQEAGINSGLVQLEPCPPDTDFAQFAASLLARATLSQGKNAQPFRILRQGSYNALYDLPLHVHWSLTYMCNYQCSYCFGQSKIDRRKFTPYDKLVNAVDNLATLNRPSYGFDILGGEPTIYPHLVELLYLITSKLKNKVHKILIVTNASRDLNYFDSLIPVSERISLIMVISVHTEFVNPDHLYEIIKRYSRNINISFALMINPDKFILVKNIFDQLCILRQDYPFDTYLQTIYEPPHFQKPFKTYTAEMLEWQKIEQDKFWQIAGNSPCPNTIGTHVLFQTFWELEENGRINILPAGNRAQYFHKGLANFKDMYCAAGTTIARIGPDGNLRGLVCANSDTGLNIYEREVFKNADFMRLVKCHSDSCACDCNDIAMKFRDKNEAEKYLDLCKIKQNRLLAKSFAQLSSQ